MSSDSVAPRPDATPRGSRARRQHRLRGRDPAAHVGEHGREAPRRAARRPGDDDDDARATLPSPPAGRKKLAGIFTSSLISDQSSRAHSVAVSWHASVPWHVRRKVLEGSFSVPFESGRTWQSTKLGGPPSARKMLPVTLVTLSGSSDARFRLIVHRCAAMSFC